jgi:predicted transcriptional regulator
MTLRDRARQKAVNPKIVGGAVLKLVGDQPGISFTSLLSATGVPEDFLQNSIRDLLANELIVGNNLGYELTDRGVKARSVVAS